MRVLILEDSEMSAYMFSFLMEKAGWATVVEGSLAAGIELVRNGGFDLVIQDVHLDDSDTVDGITKMKAATDVPVLVITANGATAKECLGAGADGYITKPIGQEELLKAVQETLAKGPRRKDNEAY